MTVCEEEGTALPRFTTAQTVRACRFVEGEERIVAATILREIPLDHSPRVKPVRLYRVRYDDGCEANVPEFFIWPREGDTT